MLLLGPLLTELLRPGPTLGAGMATQTLQPNYYPPMPPPTGQRPRPLSVPPTSVDRSDDVLQLTILAWTLSFVWIIYL